jgi:nucleoside phosphorylase
MGGGTMNRSNAFPLSLQGSSVSQSGRLPKVETIRSVEVDRYLDLQGGEEIPPCVVILTALKVEYMAVREHLTGLKEEIHPQGTVYERGTFTAGNQIWDVAIAQIGAGNSGVATEAERAIARFSPRVILFVGVAGGIKKELKIGDVVVGTKIYKYDFGKALTDRTLPRPTLGNSSHRLVQRAQAESRNSDWLDRIKPSFTSDNPSVYVEAIAAGEKVIASSRSPICKFLREYYDDAYAVEMEGFGFLEAAWRNDSVSAIVIRGISDKLDKKAQSDAANSQKVASAHASAFAFEMLSKLDGPNGTEGSQETAAEYQGEAVAVDLNQKPPESLAILHFRQNEKGYKLRMHHGQMQTLDDPEEAIITLKTEFGRLPCTVNTIGSLEGYEPKTCLLGRALQWLTYLRSKQPLFSCLVIHESDRPIVPWELLNLADQPLGVVLQTVRMTQISDDGDTLGHEQMAGDGYYCRGQAMVYTAIAEQTIGLASGIGIQAYSHEVLFREQPLQILQHFQQVELDIGLVMMTDTLLQEITFETRTFYFKRTKTLKRSPSLVVLQSGLESHEHPVLAHQFMRHGAKGVLGMLDRVNGAVVRQVIELFFEQYRQELDVPMPELLRRMRVEIAQRLEDKPTDEMAALYLATFCYAYYGHPRTVLQLTPSSG